jgi:molecular chaperone HscB
LSTQELEVNETDSLTDPMLLAEILEAREELEMATTPEEVEEIRQTNQSRFLDSRSALLSMR